MVNERAPGTATSRWCSRATRCIRTCRCGQNIAFPLTLAKLDKDTINKKVEEAARILDLTSYLDRKPANLSGGQRQRVAMGWGNRALAQGIPDGRAAVEPRRQAARADAHRDPSYSAAWAPPPCT